MTSIISNPLFWIILSLVALVAYMMFESQWLDVTEHDLRFDNLPPQFDGLRLIVVSDFHSKGLGWYEKKVIERLRRIQGDVLVIAGDMKARNVTPNEPVVEVLESLLAATKNYPFPPVYVRGNHDRRGFSHICDEREDLESLRDRSITLHKDGATIHVAGTRRTCRVTRRMRPALRKALREVDPEGFVIMVSHSPDFFRMAARRGVDLMISGDTHGGQICIPFYGSFQSKSRLGRQFNRGLVSAWGSRIYVTRGVGYTGPPFRLACRPEIAILNLKRTGGD